MTRKDEIRSEIAQLEERKRELIEEAKIPEQIKKILETRNNRVYRVTQQFKNCIHVHLVKTDDLSTVTDRIYRETKYVIHAFQRQNDGSYYVWFQKYT